LWGVGRAGVGYLLIMLYVCYIMLREVKPCCESGKGFLFPHCRLLELNDGGAAVWFILSFALFAASQVIYFLASQPLCRVSVPIGFHTGNQSSLKRNNGLSGIQLFSHIRIPCHTSRDRSGIHLVRCLEVDYGRRLGGRYSMAWRSEVTIE
jgi:hypothetical protein